MNESVLSIGQSDVLVGVHTPPRVAAANDVPAVLILTAGVVHRAGPFRLHVDLSRRLAASGYPCFRFDQAGIGDSEVRAEPLCDREGAIRDVRLVMDTFQSRHGINRFVLLGLCSGADNLHDVALCDDRVAGVVALDAFAYPTPRYYLGRYARFARRPLHALQGATARLARSPLGRWLGGLNRQASCDQVAQSEPGMFERVFAPRRRVAREIERFVERGVRALYIYSGGYTYYNYQGQFFDNFPNLRRHPRVEVTFFADADHTYFVRADRRRLVDRVENWLTAQFPCSPSRAQAAAGN